MSMGVWQFMGFAFSSFFGTLLHFLYDVTGESVFAAPFSGVNESTWEHMKLLFFPMALFSVIQWFFMGGRRADFWCVKLKGTACGLISIPVLFYTLTGAFGKTPSWVNIAIFFASAALACYCEYRKFKAETEKCIYPLIPAVIILIIAIAFVLFTFNTPTLPLFMDPLTLSYGI